MKILKTGMAGTMESSDINVIIEPNCRQGVEIHLKSSVQKQFGKQIENVIKKTLQKIDVTDVVIRAYDKGALDCVIKARVQSAAFRAAGIKENFDWEELDKWID